VPRTLRIRPCAATLLTLSLIACPHAGEARAAAQPGGVVLAVAPIPTSARPTPGTPIVSWSTGDGSPGLVTVSVNGASESVFAASPEGSVQAPWIVAGRSYGFRLYSTAGGQRRVLARFKAGQQTAAEVIAPPPRPTITGGALNRGLQLAALGLVPFLLILAGAAVREVRRRV
jgi:hypothetical protein